MADDDSKKELWRAMLLSSPNELQRSGQRYGGMNVAGAAQISQLKLTVATLLVAARRVGASGASWWTGNQYQVEGERESVGSWRGGHSFEYLEP